MMRVNDPVKEADLLRHDLEEAFSMLLPREAFVLRHRFGLAAASEAAKSAAADATEGRPKRRKKKDADSWLQATDEEVEETLRNARMTDGGGGGGEAGGGGGGSGPVVSRQVLGSLLGVSFEVRTVPRVIRVFMLDSKEALICE